MPNNRNPAFAGGNCVIEQRLVSFARGGDRGSLTSAGDSVAGKSAGTVLLSVSVELSVNSVSHKVCECVDMRLRWVFGVSHTEGGCAVGRS